eukprot:Rhum_TRINITY_DN17030_c0_g1::Rhum_TRINITY_DN17030_c0_g1_i1::g.165100::m.165100
MFCLVLLHLDGLVDVEEHHVTVSGHLRDGYRLRLLFVAVNRDVLVKRRQIRLRHLVREVRVDRCRGLTHGVVLVAHPRAHLLVAGREEGLLLQGRQHCARHALRLRLAEPKLLQELLGIAVGHVRRLLLDGGGDGAHRVPVAERLAHAVDVRVALAVGRGVLVDVADVDHLLRGEEVHLLHERPLLVRELVAHVTQQVLVQQQRFALLQALDAHLLVRRVLAALALVALTLDRLQVRHRQLVVDDGDVRQGVNLALEVGDRVVVVAAHHVDERVALADVREELVAEALTRPGALDEAGNVPQLDEARDLLRLRVRGKRAQLVQAVVDNGGLALVRVDGDEGPVAGLDVVLRQRVEHRALAHVGEANDAAARTQHEPRELKHVACAACPLAAQ